MTLRKAVTYRALWLDGVKPGWEKLVPLEEGKLDMACRCAPCIADYIFAEEAGSSRNGRGYLFMTGKVPSYQDTPERVQRASAFAHGRALPMWREEISARLARWTPSEAARGAALEAEDSQSTCVSESGER